MVFTGRLSSAVEWRCVCFYAAAKEHKQTRYLHSHLVWPGRAAAAAPLAGKDSSGPSGVEVFASQASKVGQTGV